MGAGLIKTFLGPLRWPKRNRLAFYFRSWTLRERKGEENGCSCFVNVCFFVLFFGIKVGHGKIKSGLRMTGEELMGQLRVSEWVPAVSESAASQELESVQFTAVMLLSGLKNTFLMQTSSHKSAQRGNFQIKIYVQRASKSTKLKFKLQPITAVYSFLHRCWQKSGGRLSFLLVEPRCFCAASCALAFFPFFLLISFYAFSLNY